MGRLVLVVLLVGCGSSSPKHPDAAVPDGATDVATDAGLGWQSVETVSNDGQVIVERVSYQVDGLRVFGRVCRPTSRWCIRSGAIRSPRVRRNRRRTSS